jgi:hypothetical protein
MSQRPTRKTFWLVHGLALVAGVLLLVLLALPVAHVGWTWSYYDWWFDVVAAVVPALVIGAIEGALLAARGHQLAGYILFGFGCLSGLWLPAVWLSLEGDLGDSSTNSTLDLAGSEIQWLMYWVVATGVALTLAWLIGQSRRHRSDQHAAVRGPG